MAIWLEMRCEGRNGEQRSCWSLANNGPMLMTGDTVVDVQLGHRELVVQAQRMKWKRTRKGWFCPACVTAAAEQATPDGEQHG
jgi:hypothetical protein